MGGDTRQLRFHTSPDFEAPADADHDNVYLATVRVSDGTATTTEAVTVTVTNVNDNAPVAAGDSLTVLEDAAATAVPVLTNDTDADGDTLAVTAVTQPAHGTVTLANGQVSYKPAADYNGSDSFTYTVSDGVHTTTGTVTAGVTAVNDAPSFTPGPNVTWASTAAYSAAWAKNVSAGPPDESGQALNFVVTSDNNPLLAA